MRATAHILAKDGYAELSTNRVAQVAGVSIGSLYQYFSGKEALVAALLDQHAEILNDTLSRYVTSPGATVEARVRSLVHAFVETFGSMDPTLFVTLTNLSPLLGRADVIAQAQARNIALVARELRSESSLHLTEEQAELGAFVLYHAVHGVLTAATRMAPRLLKTHDLEAELSALVLRYLQK